MISEESFRMMVYIPVMEDCHVTSFLAMTKVWMTKNMKVAIVHDDLMQWGGAERVLEGICEIYPEAPIYTSVFDRSNPELQKRFGSKKIVTSFLQKIPGWKSLYKQLFFLHPLAFEQFDFTEYNLVISHGTRFSKSVITKPGTIHINYCHTPPRFLWHFSSEKYSGLAEILFSKLRIFDSVSAKRVDFFIAGSKNAKARIEKVYKVGSQVVYPFVDLERFKDVESFDGGYFLVISRLNKYKRVDLAVRTCMELGVPLKIIGSGPELENFKFQISNFQFPIEFLGNLSDEKVVQVLAGCKALILPGEEDFGLTPLEAAALGKPVVAFKKGGALETVTSETGLFFEEQTVEALKKALLTLDSRKFNSEKIKELARQFSKEKFMKNFKETVDEIATSLRSWQ